MSESGVGDHGAMGIGGCVHPFAIAQFLIIGKSTWVFVVHFRNNGKYTGRKNATASAMKPPSRCLHRAIHSIHKATQPQLQRTAAPTPTNSSRFARNGVIIVSSLAIPLLPLI